MGTINYFAKIIHINSRYRVLPLLIVLVSTIQNLVKRHDLDSVPSNPTVVYRKNNWFFFYFIVGMKGQASVVLFVSFGFFGAVVIQSGWGLLPAPVRLL